MIALLIATLFTCADMDDLSASIRSDKSLSQKVKEELLQVIKDASEECSIGDLIDEGSKSS